MQTNSLQRYSRQSPSSRVQGFCVAALACLGILSLCMSGVSPTLAAERSHRDPLSPEEIERARTAVLNAPVWTARRPSIRPSEELLIELHQETKEALRHANAPRRADVVFYDYPSESTMRVLVDVRSGNVEKIDTVAGMQPLISRAEAARALAITLADPQANAFIRSQYLAVTGTALSDATNLLVTAGVFHADVMPEVATVAECATQRCTHLLLTSHTHQSLSAMPIVNLSRGRLLYLGQ